MFVIYLMLLGLNDARQAVYHSAASQTWRLGISNKKKPSGYEKNDARQASLDMKKLDMYFSYYWHYTLVL